MSSSRVALRSGLLAVAVTLALGLGACTGFTPLYGEAGLSTARVEVHYAPPKSRLDQIIYHDLELKLGQGADGPLVSVVAWQVPRALTSQTHAVANQPYQMTVYAAIKVTDDEGKTLFSGTRSQTADYTQGPQVLANQAAAQDASENAAHLLADTIRLTVLGALSK